VQLTVLKDKKRTAKRVKASVFVQGERKLVWGDGQTGCQAQEKEKLPR